MRIETSSTSAHRFSDSQIWRGIAPLLALLLMACSGGSADRGHTNTGASVPPAPAATPVSTPAASQPVAPGPNLTYGVVDTQVDGETPIRWAPVFNGPPRTRLEGEILWAPAQEVVRVLSPKARVTFEGGQLKADGKTVAARARSENGEVWAEVVPLARHFGALGRVQAMDRSVVLFPRETLLWLRDHGDPNAPAVREAKEAGLLDG
jgi:hypothetical protein